MNIYPSQTYSGNPVLFGPGWDFSHSLSSRRMAPPQPTPAPTVGGEKPEASSESFLDMLVPSILSMMGIPMLSEILHLKEIFSSTEVKNYKWNPVDPQIDPRQRFGPAWFARQKALTQSSVAPVKSTIHENLNKPVPQTRSFGFVGSKRKS